MARVVLVGLPGTGKPTVGRALALALGEDFVDTDDVFEELEEESAPDYLRHHGEAHFRQREIRALATALTRADVVATGGGVVTSPEARDTLRGQFTVWLDCPDEAILDRVGEGDRPLLGDRPQEQLARLRDEREEWYRQVSQRRVDAERSVSDIVGELLEVVSRNGARP